MRGGKIASALAGAALILTPLAQAEAATLRLPPPGIWYAAEGVQCASMTVAKGGREGKVHQWVWKKAPDGKGGEWLACEFAGTRTVRS